MGGQLLGVEHRGVLAARIGMVDQSLDRRLTLPIAVGGLRGCPAAAPGDSFEPNGACDCAQTALPHANPLYSATPNEIDLAA